eukprot:TRINITY_DN17499_c0_g1_i3.p1 TRINITY_DN17499_c0_g1~~TRINITY_DN17499_c0_g1_i3.p1  ORF type:complete len:411 (-),score=32.25 TRINITY_DN17499_c0_g1_i3:875-2107(-)
MAHSDVRVNVLLQNNAGTEDRPQKAGVSYRFLQQRLKAWQPILSPTSVVILYFVFGVVCIALGVYIFTQSQAVVELRYDYSSLAHDSPNIGHFDLEVDRDMEPPILVYYEIQGFHQNHRRYIKSLSNPQLKGGDQVSTLPEKYSKDCHPWPTDSTGRRVNYPCGLVAQSVFNDSFAIISKAPKGNTYSSIQVDSSSKTIAWPADIHGRYKNADPEKKVKTETGESVPRQEAMNMWLLERFPPVRCEQEDITPENPWVPAKVKMIDVAAEGSFVKVPDCRGYMTKSPKCNFTLKGKDFKCEGGYKERVVEDWGLESGHLAVWMRRASLPTFRKLWGKVSEKLIRGTKLRVYVDDNFPVTKSDGRKALVMTTSSPLGGKNDFLGFGYMALGGGCLLFSLLFCVVNVSQRAGH